MRSIMLAMTLLVVSGTCFAGSGNRNYSNHQDITVMSPGGDPSFYSVEPGIGNTFSIYNYDTGERQWYEIPNLQRNQDNTSRYNDLRDNPYTPRESESSWDWRYNYDSSLE